MGWNSADTRRTIWTFLQAGIAAAVVFASAQSKLPDTWDGAQQLAYGLALAFGAGVISALKNYFLADSSRLK